MKCPVCKASSGFYREPGRVYPEKTVMTPVPLYQRSYPGRPGYISERCRKCFDETLRMETRREEPKISGKRFQKAVPAVPAPACKNCLRPLEPTELALGSCAACLKTVDEYVFNVLKAEPDREKAFTVSGYALGLDARTLRATPMKKRSAAPGFLGRLREKIIKS